MSLVEKVRSTIKKYNMLQEHDKVLVGLSGGSDSIVLLHVLLRLKRQYSLDVHIAHLDHKFRGSESADDRKFCQDAAGRLGIDIVCEEIDIPAIVKEKGISSEEAARLERYGFFRRVAEAKRIKKIAVGHTKDDQAETVLMRVIRGAGMVGLGGISPVRESRGLTIIRPLIEIPRSEIEDFIKENKLQFRHDSSNDEVMFTRNKIRHEVIPYLRENFNPNIKEVLANMAENLRVENEFLEKFTRRKFRSTSKIKDNEILIELKRFKKQPEAIRKRVVRFALERLKGDMRRLTYQHWREIEELINKRPGSSIVDLPGGINIVKNKNNLVFQKE